MTNVWNIRRSANVSMSIALKATWTLARVIKAAEAVAENVTWSAKIRTNDWAESGHNRTHVEVVVYTDAQDRRYAERIGYVDNIADNFVAT